MSIKLVITYRKLDFDNYVASIDDLHLFANGPTKEIAKENLFKNLQFHIDNFGPEFLTHVRNCEYEFLDFKV
jgi:hypothetical protein